MPYSILVILPLLQTRKEKEEKNDGEVWEEKTQWWWWWEEGQAGKPAPAMALFAFGASGRSL